MNFQNAIEDFSKKILRKNERNITERRGDFVYKIPQNPQAEQVLKDEKAYAEWFLKEGEWWKLPDQKMIEENGQNVMKMPFYKGEVMQELREKITKWEDYFPLLQQILDLVTELRIKYNEPKWTMKMDTTKRFGKYIVGTTVKMTQNAVQDILHKKKPSAFLRDFAHLSFKSLKTLKDFDKFDEEYKIHGCLHLEHIRIDDDGKLIPIDFEHGAQYPRRLKYEDEAYIFQNLLQYFPNHSIADEFKRLWFERANADNPEEWKHIQLALNQKMLWGLYEMHTIDALKFRDSISQHMFMLDQVTHKPSFWKRKFSWIKNIFWKKKNPQE